MTTRSRVFAGMWGVATIAHLAGNWRYGNVLPQPLLVGVFLAIAGLLGTAVLIRPHRWTVVALSVTIPVVGLLEAPLLSNHWLLAGFVSLAFLLTGARWERFEVAARWIFVLFYGFASFAKLNSGFLDPETSHGLYFLNQALEGIGLGPIDPASPLAWAASWGCVLVELSVVPMLLVGRTRRYGALLGILFHGLVSLDLANHFYDFTAVLLPLLCLFLPAEFASRLARPVESMGPILRRSLTAVVACLGLGVTFASVTRLTDFTAWFLQYASFLWWTPTSHWSSGRLGAHATPSPWSGASGPPPPSSPPSSSSTA